MNTKNNQRYKSGDKKIETAFLSLIYNKSYEDIKIIDICKSAQINRSTFYAHYDDINDLVVKIENKFASSVSAIFECGTRWEHQAFVEMFEFIKKNKYFYKAFLNIPYITFAEKKHKEHILGNIKNENLLKIDDVDLFYRSNFFGAGVKELCRLWLERDCAETPEQMASIISKEYTNRN